MPYLMKINHGQCGVAPECLGNDLEQSVALSVSRGQQTSMRLLERAIAIPRMTNQLPCTAGHGMKKRTKYLLIETPGSQHPDRPVGAQDTVFRGQS